MRSHRWQDSQLPGHSSENVRQLISLPLFVQKRLRSGLPASESVFERRMIRQHLAFRLRPEADSKERLLHFPAMILPSAHVLATPDRVQ